MIQLPTARNEERRLAMLETLEFGQCRQDPGLNELADLARDLAGGNIGLVSLVDRHEIHFAGSAGFDAPCISRWDSFCNHAIERPNEAFWIEDAQRDVRFLANRFVVGEPYLRFYIGLPIQVNDCVVGTLCALGPDPIKRDADLERRLAQLARIAEATLAERHRTNATRRALAASADALIDCDAEGTIVSWSDGAERLFGYSASEAIGANVDVIVPPDMREAHHSGLKHWQRSGAARLGRRLELPALRKSGDPLDIELWMSLSHSDGLPRIHANIRDISERKSQARELTLAKAEAEAANRAKTAFLANMSHELRTPLNGVTAAADMISTTELCGHQRELADIIKTSSEQLERLIADVLDLARIESGELQLHLESVALGDIVRSVVALCGLKSAEKGVALTADIDPLAEQQVLADPVRLKQILTNLVSNAVKFTEEGLITLALWSTPSGGFRFEVRDTGIGFRPEQRELIFGRFQQADDTVTRRFGGTGLGLAISRDLVAAMGGQLDCSGCPGEGATFWFEVNLAPADYQSGQIKETEEQTDFTAVSVLVVDDNPTNRRVAELILQSASIATVAADNGETALEALSHQSFDVILMDMMMPVMDGITAVRTLRTREALQGLQRTPVVMLTANSLPDHIRASLDAGADRHLAKPITPAGLLAAVCEMLDRGKALCEDAQARKASA